ncbi:zf-HC2 domain-containing protein [Amycolatopsis sp. SID8362]|uniref:zf-HC2 domain-containing protein n=1 Tax=Amycolatopsis sp. SID8362 TaxID=2690346 RepID=UPI00136C09EA|nr:zf-HC2 domain-containing protein [Amycolatopsis sp. SID8362]NBH11592.1 zf-HC2 domain-containing protein [Amycolatopsis sp. SID8362]NED48284.1 zf-HC2 domain-containing protein [Amycolatopsis sp. SID8362]
MNHAPDRLIAVYVTGGDLPGDQLWGLEAHFESCRVCRAKIAEVAPVQPVVDVVWNRLEPELEFRLSPVPFHESPVARSRPRLRRFRWLDTWVTPAMAPWLAMIAAVTLVAVLLDGVWHAVLHVPAVQLFAPILPVLGVAASWARGLDPAYEVVAATPRAGLYLVVRRTVAVLAVVLPVLGLAGWLTGTAPALWLLPSLAFTTGTLALGGVFGVSRAAYALIAVWVAIVVLPAFIQREQAFALTTGALPVWAGIFALTTVVVALHRAAYTRLGAHH